MRTQIVLVSLLLLLTGVVFAVPVSSSPSATLPSAPAIAMSASPSNLTIADGAMGFSTVTVKSLNGFAGNVTLSSSAPPVGFGVGISPSILALKPNGTAQSTVNVNDGFNGTTTWFLNIAGASGGLTVATTTIQINGQPFIAPTFTISAPNPITVAQGSSVTVTVVVASQHGFSGTVSLTASIFPNVSGGPVMSLSPTTVSVPAGGSGTSTLTVATSSTTPVGFYNETLTGRAAQGGGFITAQFTGSLTVTGIRDWSISANPLSQNVPAGANATSTITLTSINGFTENVLLSTSPPPLCASCPNWQIVPSQVNVPAGGTATATLVFFTVQGSPTTTFTVNVTSMFGSRSHSVNVSFTIVSSKPDFSIAANPTTVVLPSGGRGNSTITLTSLNGFSGTVNLQTTPSPLCPTPACTVWSISPSKVTLTPGGTAFAVLSIIGGPAGSSGNITVTGTSGSLTHSVIVPFKISQSQPPDFTISATPSLLIIPPGFTNTSIITVTALNGFSGFVSFSLSSTPGLLANITPHNVTGSGTARLTVSALNAGNYTTTVTGTSGTLSHSVTVITIVSVPPPPPDFTLSIVPTNLTITPSSSALATVTLTSINGFSGTVTLTAKISSNMILVSFSQSSVVLSPGGSVSITLGVSASNSTASGLYLVDVTGTGGGVAHTFQVGVTVTPPPPPPDFTLTIRPTNQTVRHGSTATYTITVTGTNGFNGTVTLSATVSPVNRHGPAISLPSTVGPYSTSILTASTGRHTPAGTYTITVTATSGSLVHTFTVTLNVTS